MTTTNPTIEELEQRIAGLKRQHAATLAAIEQAEAGAPHQGGMTHD